MLKLILRVVLTYLLNRLKEPSSWRGIVLAVVAAGVALKPDQIETVVSVGLAVAGAIGAFVPDAKSSYPNDPKPAVSQGQANANINKA